VTALSVQFKMIFVKSPQIKRESRLSWCALLFGAMSLYLWSTATLLFAQTPPAKNRGDIQEYDPNLPIIFLETTNQIAADRKVPCTFSMALPENRNPDATNIINALVRIHGASSQMYPKKSFGITLAAPQKLLGMRESAHWVLNAAFIDRSLMRHKLAYDLFRSLSSGPMHRFATASRFVEVHLNNRYSGAYLLMERIDSQLLQLRAYSSNDVAHACIYKAIDHGASFAHRNHDSYEQREPDPLLGPYWKPLDELNSFVSSASDSLFFHRDTGIASRVDLDNAIDFHLLVLLTCNKDGIDKNFILARDAPNERVPKPRFFFAPWDYDGTFGRHWNSTPLPHTIWLSNHLFDRLLGNPQYRQKFVSRWEQLRDTSFSAKTVQRMITENARTLGKAVSRNANRWPIREGIYPDRATFAQDTAQMKSWIEARVAFLDEVIHQRYGSREK
jgi:spore coat protein H